MNHLSSALLALALIAPMAACSEPTDDFRSLESWENGMMVDSDAGAFRVTLSSADGMLGMGRNDLIVRVGFHDFNDPTDEGRGIPGAELEVEAWMPEADASMQSVIEIGYLGDGAYSVDNVVLTEEGVWNLDIEISVGDGMHESVSLAFDIDELDIRN